jgi:MerR family copper efflux transcriptional regulator
MRIGEIAKACTVSVDTIRHYEAVGVLPPAERGDNGYRNYPDATIARVLMIRRALRIGFSLDELSRIFRRRAAGQPPCRDVREMAIQKLAALDDEIRTMTSLRASLAETIERWNERLDKTPQGAFAHLLESLN